MTEEESLYLCNYPNYRETCIVPVYFVDSLPYIGDIERLYGRTSDQTFWTWTNGAWQQWAVGGGGSGLTFADLVEIIQEGDNVSIDIDLINETLTINATNFWEAEDATHIKPTISKTVYLERIDPTASAELTTISDTDKFSFWTTVWKRITWSNIKATLKTYFDTLYSPISEGGEFEKRFDYISKNLYYRATAPSGSAEDVAVWDIKKIEVLNDGTIDNVIEVTNYKYTERHLI